MPYTTVTVDSGALRGIDNAGVRSFLGVPYGASTGGENRFRPPQPVEPWEGVRDALIFGPSAPQADTRLTEAGRGQKLLSLLYPRTGSPVEGSPMDEDCLRLNVWAPSRSHAGPLPVLVWLHGGGFTHGSGNEMAFNGDVLAAAEDVVVVTVTHRLGILGFMDLREFGEKGSANAGMLDIVAALEWVQRNIAAFGGDPDRVTISGQSGGSAKVATLGAMPAADGLFARSIMMSGPISRANRAEAAAALRAAVFRMLGATTPAELRSLPLERLIGVQAEVLRRTPLEPAGDELGTGRVALDEIPGFAPSLDARDLPRDPFGEDAPEALADKALLIGWTTHEAGMFLANDPSYGPGMTAEDAATRVAAMPGGSSYEQLAAAHPAEPPFLLFARQFSTQMFQAPARRVADLAADRTRDVWAYEFRQPTEVLGGILGACHSLELAYVFGTVDRVPLTGRHIGRLAVARDMMRAWAAFARTGDPGWTRWTSAERVVHPFGTPIGPDLELPADTDLSAAV